MLLGGIRYLLPVIDAAHKQGYHVITADYLPNNIAHKYSDEYVNVSIVDREAVLRAAIEKRIDGIMSFGVDPGVVSAAYVQQELNLPAFGPLESVEILQNKDRFRNFLAENGFNVPLSKGYSSFEEFQEDIKGWTFPVMVKPTDSAGSKGVSRANNPEDMMKAYSNAIRYSISGRVIVEQFIEKEGCSSDSDCFLENGVLSFVSFSAQRFDLKANNPYTPSAYSWPSTFTEQQSSFLKKELQRLLSLLGMRTGVYNIETRIGIDGKPYIMEVTPRGGGNRLSEVVRYATGMDLITACVRDSVGDSLGLRIEQRDFLDYWVEIILHSNSSGYLKKIGVSSREDCVVDYDLWVREGDYIKSFCGANDTIGTMIMRFSEKEEMNSFLSSDNLFEIELA